MRRINIKGYNGKYEVFENGDVFSLDRIDSIGRSIKGRKLSKATDTKGYYYYNLYTNGKQKIFRLHRLVADHFIENPNNFGYINHKDHDRKNNSIDNLEWCTIRYNCVHRYNGIRRSNYVGLCFIESYNKWKACIYHNKKSVFLGYFINEEDAAQAYICYKAIHNLI